MIRITSALAVLARRLIVAAVLVGAVILAPAYAIIANDGAAIVSTEARGHHGGPNYWSITGARIGAPGEREVSTYGGSHKHLWVEQQLYGPGVVGVPHVDNTVHQSR